jgi:hypothetical protein
VPRRHADHTRPAFSDYHVLAIAIGGRRRERRLMMLRPPVELTFPDAEVGYRDVADTCDT